MPRRPVARCDDEPAVVVDHRVAAGRCESDPRRGDRIAGDDISYVDPATSAQDLGEPVVPPAADARTVLHDDERDGEAVRQGGDDRGDDADPAGGRGEDDHVERGGRALGLYATGHSDPTVPVSGTGHSWVRVGVAG